MTITNRYWSRIPGQPVHRDTGEVIENTSRFMPTVTTQDWYETLVLDISEHVRLTTILTSLDVNSILENSIYYKPYYHGEYTEDVFLGPAKKMGTLHGKDVWVDEQMDRNILHIFYSKDTFDKECVSFHVIGISDCL